MAIVLYIIIKHFIYNEKHLINLTIDKMFEEVFFFLESVAKSIITFDKFF